VEEAMIAIWLYHFCLLIGLWGRLSPRGDTPTGALEVPSLWLLSEDSYYVHASRAKHSCAPHDNQALKMSLYQGVLCRLR